MLGASLKDRSHPESPMGVSGGLRRPTLWTRVCVSQKAPTKDNGIAGWRGQATGTHGEVEAGRGEKRENAEKAGSLPKDLSHPGSPQGYPRWVIKPQALEHIPCISRGRPQQMKTGPQVP